ncbi:MAG: hypothetical protein FWE88_04395 [Phycisphaerae bacterium]|nr:hypothetical protein [Phycisphaerae bacterium]
MTRASCPRVSRASRPRPTTKHLIFPRRKRRGTIREGKMLSPHAGETPASRYMRLPWGVYADDPVGVTAALGLVLFGLPAVIVLIDFSASLRRPELLAALAGLVGANQKIFWNPVIPAVGYIAFGAKRNDVFGFTDGIVDIDSLYVSATCYLACALRIPTIGIQIRARGRILSVVVFPMSKPYTTATRTWHGSIRTIPYCNCHSKPSKNVWVFPSV